MWQSVSWNVDSYAAIQEISPVVKSENSSQTTATRNWDDPLQYRTRLQILFIQDKFSYNPYMSPIWSLPLRFSIYSLVPVWISNLFNASYISCPSHNLLYKNSRLEIRGLNQKRSSFPVSDNGISQRKLHKKKSHNFPSHHIVWVLYSHRTRRAGYVETVKNIDLKTSK
jgi:hypothetical protein